jgi:hypothetical protein
MARSFEGHMSEVDWEDIAREMAQQLSMALTKLRTDSSWTGTLRNNRTGEMYTWEESFIRSIERIPNWTVDRRWIEAKYLPAKQRRVAYAALHAEHVSKQNTDAA